MSSGFYRAFEDRHRGSRELILGRLEVYLPFIETLKAWHTPCTALDLGCGRGEWLQLLQNNGVQARGVDLDEGMLQACHELNLQAEQGDAIAALQALPDNSLSIVSGFHIVEHIDFAQVQQLVEQALRVLKPGGLLILETPNAENLVVGTNSFYLDPTHLRPLPHTLLAFVTELAGFSRNKVLRLQEDPALHQQPPGLIQVLGGVSPDYAVVAQKPADSNTMARFDQVFSQEYGISINQIAERYDQALTDALKALQARLHQLATEEVELRTLVLQTVDRAATAEQQNQQMNSELHKAELRAVQLETLAEQLRQQLLQATQRLYQEEARARQVEGELREASTRTAQLEARSEITQNQLQSQAEQQHQLTQQLEQTTQQLNESLGNAHNWYVRATEAEQHHAAAQQRINDLLHSTSWKITAPLRGLRRLIVWLLALPFRAIKALLRPVLSRVIRFALNRPALRQRWANRLRKYPKVFAHLRQFAIKRGLVVEPPMPTLASMQVSSPVQPPATPVATAAEQAQPATNESPNLDALTPRAKQIYHDLKAAIEKNKEHQ
jgi:O-antigen chain-terminating methyltransferase